MMRDAVVVALLSQLSQLCGAALVRVRDEVSRFYLSHKCLLFAQAFLRVARRRPRSATASWDRLSSAPDVRGWDA